MLEEELPYFDFSAIRQERVKGRVLPPPGTPLADDFHKNPLKSVRDWIAGQGAIGDWIISRVHPLLREQGDKVASYLSGGTMRETYPLWSDGFLLSDEEILVCRNMYQEAQILKRTPSSIYWPSEEKVADLIPNWSDILMQHLQSSWNTDWQDCDGPFQDLADHWRYAKRRYAVKYNPCSRLAYLIGIDPECRARRFDEQYPQWVINGLYQADMEVGIALWHGDIYSTELGGTLG